jgi:CRISPR-associated endonuclease/helicase Cas3
MTIDRDVYRKFFQGLTGRTPYDYQISVAAELCSGRNVVLRAPTGAGKTWAVLAPFLFEGWERRPGRLIYALPLRTLAQGVYREAREAAGRLGHRLDAREDERGREVESPLVTLQTGEHPDDRFFDRGRIIVTTYDQVLSGLLCGPYGLSDRLHNVNAAGVIGALVVFDEFHLMEPARAFLTAAAGLNLFRGLCQSVWMTATATPPLDELLADAVDTVAVPENEAKMDALVRSLPSVTTVRREIRAEAGLLSAEAVIETYQRRALRDGVGRASGSGLGGRSIILLNVVGRAQAMFQALRAWLETTGAKIPLVLLHSRFFAEDRRTKEARIRELFGRGSTGPGILVATQVVEAGLDISCDDLHTELCPMNALVQRAGRCARFEGEEGTVHVHPLPDVERAWLPYGDAAGEDPALGRTRELIARVRRAILDPREAAAWVQEVHAEGDEVALRRGWRGQRRTCVDRILRNAIERDPVRVADLIRGEDTDSVRIILTAGEPPATPAEREGLSLSRWSITRLVREASTQGRAGWWWDPSSDDELWRPLGSVVDLQRAYVVCLPTTIAAYDAEVGLRFGVAGDQESPARHEPKRPGWAPLHAESWVDHAQAVAREAMRRLAREAWAATPDDPRQRWEAAGVAEGFLRRYGLAPGVFADAARFCAVLHDLGKLGAGWQRWAEAAQQARDPGYVHSTALAHTDFDPGKPEDRARERVLGVRRPPHAPASAYYARLFVGQALASVSAERQGLVASACLAAILAHHGGWWPNDFEGNVPPLWPGWEAAVKEVVKGAPSMVDLLMLRRHGVVDLLSVVVGPDEIEEGWPLVAYLTRNLRLSDQRATAEAGCHE